MFMQAKSSIHTWIWNDAAIKPASAACGIAEPHWPTISQTSESRLTDCQNNLKVKSAAACSIQSCNHLDNVSFGEIQAAFPEDLRSADAVWAHAMHDVRRPTLSSSTSAGENEQATCARTSGTAMEIGKAKERTVKEETASNPRCNFSRIAPPKICAHIMQSESKQNNHRDISDDMAQ